LKRNALFLITKLETNAAISLERTALGLVGTWDAKLFASKANIRDFQNHVSEMTGIMRAVLKDLAVFLMFQLHKLAAIRSTKKYSKCQT